MSLSNGKETIDNRSFGRRAFLKGTAAALGLAAVSGTGCAPKPEIEKADDRPEPPEEQIYQGVCRGNCGGGCRMNVHVREGKVVKTSVIEEADPSDTMICPRGLSHAQRIYAPERLEYPMRRVEGTARGAGEWERLSWDEAISYISTTWKSYIEEFGSSSIANTYGAGTYANNQYIYMRLFNLLGSTMLRQGYDMAALEQGWAMCGMSQFLIGNTRRDVRNAKYIFTWCANTTNAQLSRWVYLREAIENNGAKHIVIDPIYTDAAAKADLWVPIRPGSDGALALAMIKIIIDEGKADEGYLSKQTVAPFLVKATDKTFLRMSDLGTEPTEGPVNPRTGKPTLIDPIVVIGEDGAHGAIEDIGSPAVHGTYEIQGISVTTAYDLLIDRVSEWTPERASEVTEIPVETILDLAHMYAEGPSHLNLGFGNDHWGNGASITHCHVTLALIAGQIGKEGTGIGGTQGQSSSSGYPGENLAGAMFPEGAVGGIQSCLFYLPEIMETGSFNGTELTIKSIFSFCGNPLACQVDRNALMAAFDKVEFIVSVDTVMNDTTRYSDVVLPIPHWFEYETYVTCPTVFARMNEKAIDPPFECKENIEVARLLGEALGFKEAMDFDSDSFHNIFLDTERAKQDGLSWQDLKEKKQLQMVPDDYIYGNDENPFKTEFQRAIFYFEKPTPLYDKTAPIDSELVALPFFEKPIEAWYENDLINTYPLTIISHRDKFKVHTSFAACPWFEEIQPEPTLSISSFDASSRGISEGDYIKAFNDRGNVVMKAHIDDSMRPGVVWTEHTWLDEQYVEGHLAELTSRSVRHRFPSNHPFDTLCEVEKYTKEA